MAGGGVLRRNRPGTYQNSKIPAMVLHLLLEHGSSLRKPRTLKICAHMALAAIWTYHHKPKELSWLPQLALAHLCLGVILHRIRPAKSRMEKYLQKCSDKPHIYRDEMKSEEHFGYERHSVRTACGKHFVLVTPKRRKGRYLYMISSPRGEGVSSNVNT